MEYRIDAWDRLVAVSEDWEPFAVANDAPELARGAVLGTQLWDHVHDLATRELYRKLIRRAREGHELRFRIRCDAPGARRVLEVTLSPLAGGGVRFRVVPRAHEDRDPVELLRRGAARSDDWLTLCSWCGRIRLASERWVEIETGVSELGLLADAPMPQLTHGMCGACDTRIQREGELDASDLPEA
jgi:hypothetical protein